MNKKTKSRQATELPPAKQLERYFDGLDRPKPRDLLPATFGALAESIDAARQALLAPFPDLAEAPESDAEAREIMTSCVTWAERTACAFNANEFSMLPFGLQTHFQMRPGGRWARDYLGSLPAHLSVTIVVDSYKRYLEIQHPDDELAQKWSREPRAYWSSIQRELYWRYRGDRAACRRVLQWVTRALREFNDEELPRISYVKPLRNRMHQVRVSVLGAEELVELKDHLVKFLASLATGRPVRVEHRSVKQNLITTIRSLSNCIAPASGERPPTGAIYRLVPELVGRIEMKNYAAATG